jgi:lipoprotein-anchoring transpeptidase ErfK/SrfK
MPGVYQILEHVQDAPSTHWNLSLPAFLSIYDVQPGFTNGIHGFPTRNSGGILWQSDLGHPITYGCVLLSTENAQLLYNWAEDGVVIEVQP